LLARRQGSGTGQASPATQTGTKNSVGASRNDTGWRLAEASIFSATPRPASAARTGSVGITTQGRGKNRARSARFDENLRQLNYKSKGRASGWKRALGGTGSDGLIVRDDQRLRTGTNDAPWRGPYFLRLDHARVAVRKPPRLSAPRRSGFEIGQRLGQPMTHRAGLAGQAPRDGADDVVLVARLAATQRLVISMRSTGRAEDTSMVLVFTTILRCRLDPDAGDRVLALAGA